MEKKQNVPALRFPGFSGEWKKKRLEEMGASFSYGLNAAATTYDGQHKYLRITDIDDESRKFSGKELTSPNVDLSNASDYLDYKLQENDIVFARTGASVGKTYLYDTSDGDVYYAGFLIRVKIDSKYDANFIFQKTLTSDYSHFVVVTSQRSGQPGINAQEYANWEMLVPELNEQKKIGRFLTDFDKNIFVCREKIKKLQQFQQAMLMKLFPREGAAEPELRFRGFSGKWKSQKMKDLGSFLKGKLYSKKNIQTSGVPLILYGRLYTQYELVIDEVDTFAVPYENSVWSIGGEVIVPASGETAEDIAIASVVKQKGILLGGDLNIIRPNDTVSSVFLALSISYGHIHNELAKRAQGKSIVHIHNSDLVQLDIRLPSIEEQKAIGDFFYQLDRYISLQQKKLERMQRLKAALLEKLFV